MPGWLILLIALSVAYVGVILLTSCAGLDLMTVIETIGAQPVDGRPSCQGCLAARRTPAPHKRLMERLAFHQMKHACDEELVQAIREEMRRAVHVCVPR